MNEKHDFEAFSRKKLDETIDDMDGVTRARLAAMRRQAMVPNQSRRDWWLPVSLATAMTALALVWMIPPPQGGSDMDMAAIEDMDLLAADVEMDLLEDVEFYQWLNDGNHAG